MPFCQVAPVPLVAAILNDQAAVSSLVTRILLVDEPSVPVEVWQLKLVLSGDIVKLGDAILIPLPSTIDAVKVGGRTSKAINCVNQGTDKAVE